MTFNLTVTINDADVRQLLRDNSFTSMDLCPTAITLTQEKVAAAFGIPASAMKSASGCEQFAWPRQIAMYIIRRTTGLSLKYIGSHFSGRDHGTVIHAMKHVEDRMETEPDTKQLVAALEASIRELLQAAPAACPGPSVKPTTQPPPR